MAILNYSFEISQNHLDVNLKNLNPEFISVAYTNHSLSFFKTTLSTAILQKNKTNVRTVIHVPASSFSSAELNKLMITIKQSNLDSMLILSGEKKSQISQFTSSLKLTLFMHKKFPNLNILCACHPEAIISEKSLAQELLLMKKKELAGCSLFISQIFFDPALFKKFVLRCRAFGIKSRIKAGIMPITTFNQVSFIKNTLQLHLPAEFSFATEASQLRTVGINFAINQINGLMLQKITDFHFFATEDYNVVESILKGVS